MSGESTKRSDEPSAESLAEMPEVTDVQRFQRLPGRGHHVHRRAGDLIRVDADVLAFFGSAEAVNAALRALIAEGRARPR
jgi:hypothetical protein